MTENVTYDANRATALHEAGHALAAAAVGFEVRELWVDGWGGYCGYRQPRGHTRAAVVVALAGWMTECIYGGKLGLIKQHEAQIRAYVLNESELLEIEEAPDLAAEAGDEEDIARILLDELTSESERLETLNAAGREAESIIRDGWETLEKLADLLLAAEPGVTPQAALELLHGRR